MKRSCPIYSQRVENLNALWLFANAQMFRNWLRLAEDSAGGGCTFRTSTTRRYTTSPGDWRMRKHLRAVGRGHEPTARATAADAGIRRWVRMMEEGMR